jgi:ABC-type glycerol-3-phosphate transport system permease component
LTDGGYAKVGQTELHLSKVNGDPENYVVISSATWQPVINEEAVSASAFVADSSQLANQALRAVQGVQLPVATYDAPTGTPYDVLVLLGGTSQSLVIPLDKADSVRLARIEDMSTVRGDTIKDTPVRLQDGYSEQGDVHNVMLVSEPRDMAMIVPQSAVSDAFDVNPATMQRAMHVELRFQGFQEALQTKVGETYFTAFFRNSFVLVVLNTLGHILSCIVVAYAFARLRAPGKSFLFIVLLSTMMLPFPVTILPLYEFFRDVHAVNTLWPLFVRSFFGNAFLIFMLRQFFSTIPRELEEAARMDGANVLQILWRIIVPLSKPAIATVVIFTFWWTWNSFLEPFIYLSSPELFPVSLGLNFFQDQYGTIFYDRMIAASVLSMVPMLLIFFFAQRYFIEGIQLTGMKG